MHSLTGSVQLSVSDIVTTLVNLNSYFMHKNYEELECLFGLFYLKRIPVTFWAIVALAHTRTELVVAKDVLRSREVGSRDASDF